MVDIQGRFNRSALLFGEDGMARLASSNVIIFGVGGVGSWCAEALVRTGIRRLTIVDSDKVCITNCNRQLMAADHTVGMVKVEALKNRLLDINPDAEINALQKTYTSENAFEFHLEEYDYIIDAIDSLKDKVDLMLRATELMHQGKKKGSTHRTSFLSSMGAALRIDPTKVRVDEFWNVKGDALARAIRNKMKRDKTFPKCKFQCVYSEETPLANVGLADTSDNAASMFNKAQVNGSLCHVTAIFGMTLAGQVLKDILNDK